MGHPMSVPGQSNNRLTLCGMSKLRDCLRSVWRRERRSRRTLHGRISISESGPPGPQISNSQREKPWTSQLQLFPTDWFN